MDLLSHRHPLESLVTPSIIPNADGKERYTALTIAVIIIIIIHTCIAFNRIRCVCLCV